MGDYEESLDKINAYYSVAFIPDDPKNCILLDDEIVFETDDIVIGNFSFDMFCKMFGHTPRVPTMIKVISYDVISNSDSEYVLPYHKNEFFERKYGFLRQDKTYLKGVFLPKLALRIPCIVNGLVLKSATINITEGDFIPTVSRDNVSTEMQEQLGYAIGKALHLWILEHAQLTAEQKSLLSDFIRYCYPLSNNCLKGNQ